MAPFRTVTFTIDLRRNVHSFSTAVHLPKAPVRSTSPLEDFVLTSLLASFPLDGADVGLARFTENKVIGTAKHFRECGEVEDQKFLPAFWPFRSGFGYGKEMCRPVFEIAGHGSLTKSSLESLKIVGEPGSRESTIPVNRLSKRATE